MNRTPLKLALLGGAIALSATALFAAEPATPENDAGHHGMMDDNGSTMMGHGMMGMMNSCREMMRGTRRGADEDSLAVPQLPPGNERLQLQMRGEMMQKLGEIASRYADKVKESPR
jgi:hypothetical protein